MPIIHRDEMIISVVNLIKIDRNSLTLTFPLFFLYISRKIFTICDSEMKRTNVDSLYKLNILLNV